MHRLSQDHRGGARGAAGTVVDAPLPAIGRAVGSRAARLDAPAKVTGSERFGADAWPKAGTAAVLAMRVIRSPHAHARFEVGDLRELRARWPGLVDVVSAADVPNNAFAIFPDLRDQPVLADGVVRFRGEAVLALVGDAATVLSIADGDVPIRYQPLAAHESIAAALAAADHSAALHPRYPDNVLCRGRVVRGDVDAALAGAAIVVDSAFTTRHVEHAYIEPEAGYAEIIAGSDASGAPLRRVRIFACTQTPYMDRDEIASILQVAPKQVHIVPSAIGGGFGGKLDLSVQPLVAVAAWKPAGRCAWSTSGPSRCNRAPSAIRRRCARARRAIKTADCSPSIQRRLQHRRLCSSWGPAVANRVPIHASGPYRVPHVRALTRAVLTNDSIAGAFRGFGVPQSTLLGELLIDELAARAGQGRARVPSPQRPRRRRCHADRPDARGQRRPAVRASTRSGRPGR